MKGYVFLFAVISAVVVAIWVSNLMWVPRHYPTLGENGQPTTQPIPSPGIFGDMFGGVNALFAGLSAAGVIVTLLMQARQLRDQANDQKKLLVIQQRMQATQEAQAQFASAQAEALQAMVNQQRDQNRRRALEFLLKSNREEIEKQTLVANRMYSSGPEQVRHENAKKRIQDLKAQNAGIETELQSLPPQ